MKKHGALWNAMLVSLGSCLVTMACGDDKSDSSCVEGTGRPCTCPDGTESVAPCGSDGTWEECDCDGTDDGSGGRTTRVCLAGELQSCIGPGNCEGIRECNEDGSGFGVCTCPETGGTSGGGTGGGGTGGGGTGGGGTGGGGTGGGGTGGGGTGGGGTGGGGTGGGGTGGGGTGGAAGVSGAGAGGAGAGGVFGGEGGLAGNAGTVLAGAAGFGGVAGVPAGGASGNVGTSGAGGSGGVTQVGGTAGQGGIGGASPVGGAAGIAGMAGVAGSAGAGGDAGAGAMAGAAGEAFWTDGYNSTGLPEPPGGSHNAGETCMSCHAGSGGAASFEFAGTVYSSGTAPAQSVQVGVLADGVLYSAYSATNGNFWVPGAGAISDWSNVEIRIRTATGESIMVGDTETPTADCNTCHQQASRLYAP